MFHPHSLGTLLGLGLASTAVAQAQTKPAPSKPAAPKAATPAKTDVAPIWTLASLPMPVLPGVPVEFAFVGTKRDLLGVVQSLARGGTVAGAPAVANAGKKVQLVSDPDLLLMVRDLNFLRAQSFNFLKMETAQDQARAAAKKPATGTMNMEQFNESFHPKRPKRIDVQEFYGKAFQDQKGVRQFFSSAGDIESDGPGDTTISIWVFESPRSWALVTQGPSRAIVVRADGMPDLEPLGRLFRTAISQ